MINFIDYDLNTREGLKEATMDTLDHELEIFDPICDGAVGEGEGLGYLREEVSKFFKKNKDFDMETLETTLIEHLNKRMDKLYLNVPQKIGYMDGVSILEEVLEDIKNQKESEDLLND